MMKLGRQQRTMLYWMLDHGRTWRRDDYLVAGNRYTTQRVLDSLEAHGLIQKDGQGNYHTTDKIGAANL